MGRSDRVFATPRIGSMGGEYGTWTTNATYNQAGQLATLGSLMTETRNGGVGRGGRVGDPVLVAGRIRVLKSSDMRNDSNEELLYAADAIALLSLDLTGPFFGDIGLHIREPNLLRAMLREMVVEQAFRFRRPAPDDLALLLRDLYERLPAAFGAPTAAAFRSWFVGVLFPSPSDDLARVELVFHKWLQDVRRRRVPSFDLRPRETELQAKLTEVMESRDMSPKIESVRAPAFRVGRSSVQPRGISQRS